MRAIVAGLLPLLLGACFSSENPRIPEAALSRPADFAGSFWWLSQADRLEAKVVEVRPGKAGSLSLTDKDPARLRLVEIMGAKLYLFITDGENNTASYYLLQRREDGIWEVDDISVAASSAFAEQNLAWLDAIARRHQLSLSNDTSDTDIEGNVHGMAIPDLFRDTAFLSALEVRPLGFYLPMRRQPVSVAEIPLPTRERTGTLLGFETAPPVGDGVACPAGFAGSYIDRASWHPEARRIEVRKLPGCRFELAEETWTRTLTLLPFDPERNLLLGLEQWRDQGGAWHGYVWFVQEHLESDGNHWVFTQVTLHPSTLTPSLDQLRRNAMSEAAARHGLAFSEEGIHAPYADLRVEQVDALLRDGQFTSGLSELTEPGRKLDPAGETGAPRSGD